MIDKHKASLSGDEHPWSGPPSLTAAAGCPYKRICTQVLNFSLFLKKCVCYVNVCRERHGTEGSNVSGASLEHSSSVEVGQLNYITARAIPTFGNIKSDLVWQEREHHLSLFQVLLFPNLVGKTKSAFGEDHLSLCPGFVRDGGRGKV